MSTTIDVQDHLMRGPGQFLRKHWSVEVVRLTAAIILLCAAVLKVLYPTAAATKPSLPALGQPLPAILVAIEGYLGAALLFNVSPRRTLQITGLCFAAFATYS